MLKNFENWLLEQNYSASTSADYSGRIERLCRNEQFTLSHLVENITSSFFNNLSDLLTSSILSYM